MHARRRLHRRLRGHSGTLSSFFVGGRGERLYWDLATGALAEPDEADFIIITQWRLGAIGIDGKFVQVAAYPDDYQPRAPMA